MFADLRISRYEPGSVMAPHQHDEASMNLIVGGDFVERIGKGTRAYARGYIAYCPAGMTHSQHFGPRGARQIIFRPQKRWLAYLADSQVNLDAAPYAGSDGFRRLGDRLLEELHHGDSVSDLACEGLLLEIVAAFGRTGTRARSDAVPPAWLRAARDFIHANAFAPLSIARIAKAAGRHEIHLAREFRRFYRTSIGAYLRQLRAEEAARKLRHRTHTISEIAFSCGFASHAHLCREFKARFGMTPSEYRRQDA